MMKAKSRSTAGRSDASSAGRAFDARALASGMASRKISNPATGPFRSKAATIFGCSSPKNASGFLPTARVSERPGGLRGEGVGAVRPLCPVAGARSRAYAGGNRCLRAGHAGGELRAEFEQHEAFNPARLVAPGRREERRQHAWTQRIEFGGNRILQLPCLVAAA